MARTVAALVWWLVGPAVALAQQTPAPADGPAAPAQQPPEQRAPASAAGPPGEGDGSLEVMVVDAATYGIDPVVGEHVTHRARETAAGMGYRVLERTAAVEAAERTGMAYPPTPADLWRAGFAAGAERVVFARAWAHGGRYVIEVVVASLDGTGPFFARGTAAAPDLHTVVAGLVREALPPPARWDAEQAAQWSGRAGGEGAPGEGAGAPDDAAAPGASQPADTLAAPAEADPYAGAEPATPPEPTHRVELAVQTEGVIGTSSDGFYNHLLGVRIGYRVGIDTTLAAYLAYANLTGRNGRVSNVLPMAMVEHRVRVSDERALTLPLRFGLGYLPYNGPVVRLSAGINVPVGERVEVAFDLLAPTFWVLPDRTAVALDLAAEVVFRL